MILDALPFSTPYDPAEDPPGSRDPLGTAIGAERLADVLFAGMTARMWRVRLLTFSAVTALVAERAMRHLEGREELRVEARLAFERLFVSALVRAAQQDGGLAIMRRVPGRRRATQALLAHQALTRGNFLKGPSVNGPVGVMARLAEHLELVGGDGRLGTNGNALVLCWSDEQDLPGVLDDSVTAARRGALWVDVMARAAADSVLVRRWPGDKGNLWDALTRHLRPDGCGPRERQRLFSLLRSEPTRARMLDLIAQPTAKRLAVAERGDRGALERTVLLRGVRPALGRHALDRAIAATVGAADGYERASALLETAFATIVTALRMRGSQASIDGLLNDGEMAAVAQRVTKGLPAAATVIDRQSRVMRSLPSLIDVDTEPLDELHDDACAAARNPHALIELLLSRHERVQSKKNKSVWIERGRRLTLLRGGGEDDDDSGRTLGFTHPFRVQNAYSFLQDLGRVRGVVGDAEVEG